MLLLTAPPSPALPQSQQRAARGFMSQAVSALRMLNTLTADPAVQRGFLHEPVATRAATAVRLRSAGLRVSGG